MKYTVTCEILLTVEVEAKSEEEALAKARKDFPNTNGKRYQWDCEILGEYEVTEAETEEV